MLSEDDIRVQYIYTYIYTYIFKKKNNNKKNNRKTMIVLTVLEILFQPLILLYFVHFLE